MVMTNSQDEFITTTWLYENDGFVISLSRSIRVECFGFAFVSVVSIFASHDSSLQVHDDGNL